MAELRVWDVLPKFGWKGEMGRVVVSKNDEGIVRSPQVTGRFFWCCNRAFLSLESFQKHQRSGGCKTEEGATDSDDDEMTIDTKSPQNGILQNGRPKSLNSISNGHRHNVPHNENSKLWFISGRKVSNLKRDRATGSSNASDAHEGPLCKTERDARGERAPPSLTSAPFDVMAFINLEKSEDGMIILRCKKCNYTSGETAVITEHILKTHSKSPEQNRIDHYQPKVKVETCLPNENESSNGSTDTKGLFTCELCSLYKTTFSGNLELHKKSAHGPKNGFSCKFCTCAYATKGGLTQHVNRFHKLNSTESSRHSSSDNKIGSFGGSRLKKATCNLCGYTSDSALEIENHKLTAHIPNGKFPCSLCSCVHDTRAGAIMHLNTAHKTNGHFFETRKVTAVVKPSAKLISVEKWVEQTVEQHQLVDEDEEHTDEEHQLAEEKIGGGIRNDLETKNLVKEKLHSTITGPFKCAVCSKTFARKCHLIVHSRTAHRKKNTTVKNLTTKDGAATPLQGKRCLMCQKTFTTAYHLAIHNATSHVHGGAYPCPTKGCKCVMSTKEGLKNHLRKCRIRELSIVNVVDNDKGGHSEIVMTKAICDLCGFSANNKAELNTHIKDSHVICGVECICGCTFTTATELTNHKNNECPKSLGTLKIVNVVSMASPETSKEAKSMPLPSNPEVFTISCFCGKKFKSRSELVKHKRECKENKKEDDDNLKQTNPIEALNVDQRPSEPEVRCLECNKTFKNENGLKTHNAILHNVFYDNCEICGVRTPTYMVYKSHNKSCHVKGGIPCPECPCTFKSIEGLSFHFYALHKCKLDKESLELRCSKCDYITYKQTDMEKHEKAGHIPKPAKPPREKTTIKCEHCTYEGTFNAVEGHMKTNHVENGFKCHLCSNSFATRAGCRIHLHLIHQSTVDELEEDKLLRKCQLCEFTTTNLTEFERHSTKNHVVGGFKCDYCSNSFLSESGLSWHVRTLHEKQSRVDFSKCQLCDYKTGNRKNYKSHMKTCHVENGVQCPKCPCTLRNADSLYHHAWMMHKIRIDKNDYMLDCEYCDYKTLYSITLKQHVKSFHSVTTPMTRSSDDDMACPICEVVLPRSGMEDHTSRAHVEGGHPCPYCKCSFANQSGVRQHARARHGKKMEFTKEWDTDVFVEPCTVCDMRFKTKSGLSSHCVQKHGFALDLPKTVKTPTRRTCDLCHAEFTESIASHLKRYHVENGFKCLHCCCTFETFAGRSRHMIKAHKVLLVRNCNICGNKFLGTIKKHMNKCHVDNGLPCDYCCCTFESLPGKHIHERKIHNSMRPKGSRICDLCKFTITAPLQEHIKRCHVPDGVQCSYCPCSFQTEQGKIQHLKIRHKVTVSLTQKVCEICGIMPLVPMKYHLEQSHVPNGIRCSHCSCCFRSQLSKTRHLERYHNIKVKVKTTVRKCTLCGITLRSPLQMHLRKHHVKNGYPCSDCTCSYLTASARRIHLLKAHNKKDEPNPALKGVPRCKLCGYILHETENMADHMTRNHLHTNPHKCNRCVCRFKTSIGLQQHLSKDHKTSGPSPDTSIPTSNVNSEPPMNQANHSVITEKSTSNVQPAADCELEREIPTDRAPGALKCSLCPRTFPTKTGLKIHVKHIHSSGLPKKEDNKDEDLGGRSPAVNHSPGTCDMEDQDSNPSFNSSVERNILNHKSNSVVGKDKLTCGKCGYLATSLSQLNFHLQKSHVRNSPFPCTICTCGFAKEAELVRHQKVLHRE